MAWRWGSVSVVLQPATIRHGQEIGDGSGGEARRDERSWTNGKRAAPARIAAQIGEVGLRQRVA
jgi:hypothetical protein